MARHLLRHDYSADRFLHLHSHVCVQGERHQIPCPAAQFAHLRPGGQRSRRHKSANGDSIVWRQVLASVNPQSIGSTSAPSHSDPQAYANEKVLDLLDNSADTILDGSFSFRVPLIVLMKDDKTFSPAGHRLLGNIAFGLRQYGFDLIIQIDHADVFPTAFRLSKQLTDMAGCPPSRTGISLCDNGTRQRDSIRFMFVARQK